MPKQLTITSSWTFNSHIALTAFIIKFDAIQPLFFPNNSLNTTIGIVEGNTVYNVNLINKKPQIQGVGKIDDNESRIGAYDSASFMKHAKSNQKPNRTSYMRRMKPSKTTNK